MNEMAMKSEKKHKKIHAHLKWLNGFYSRLFLICILPFSPLSLSLSHSRTHYSMHAFFDDDDDDHVLLLLLLLQSRDEVKFNGI